MATIIGGLFTSHVPGIGGAIARGVQKEPYWAPFFDGFAPVHDWLAAARPDVAVVFYNDHGLNFFLDKMPTFAVGAAETYRNADEGWGLPVQREIAGDPALSWHIIESLVAEEFDVTTCQSMLVDHAVVVPFQLCWPGGGSWPVRLVPIALNTVQHPLPSPKRCLALGRAVGRALQSWQGNERILVMGTGGLSHQLDGQRAGFINQTYDRFCLDNLPHDVDALTKISAIDVIEEAGSQGVEIINWIAARGALGDAVTQVTRNYHIPISNTAAATMLLATREVAARAA
ncbi:MAG: protocatechuate 3,4-dioxygenase [Sphingobium sp.]|nr:protocatechuate 3,4-dioxygenase [Sphingobium sp.]